MKLQDYFRLVDALREQRRAPDWKPEADRPLLAQLEDMYEELSDDDRDEAERQGGRGWPTLFDAHASRYR